MWESSALRVNGVFDLLRKYDIKCYLKHLIQAVGCGTSSLTLREERELRVFENRVLRRMFGTKRDEVTGGWRKLHEEELHNLYSSPSVIRMIKTRRMRRAGHVERMRRRRIYI
jgi:hypothetical protein